MWEKFIAYIAPGMIIASYLPASGPDPYSTFIVQSVLSGVLITAVCLTFRFSSVLDLEGRHTRLTASNLRLFRSIEQNTHKYALCYFHSSLACIFVGFVHSHDWLRFMLVGSVFFVAGILQTKVFTYYSKCL